MRVGALRILSGREVILGQITPVNYAGLPPCQQTQRIKIGTFRFFRRIYIWLADFCSLTSDLYNHIIFSPSLEFGKSFHGNIGYRQVVQ